MQLDLNGPPDIDALAAFLDSERAPADCASLCELDGILTAVAIGPELILPSEWLGLVWGDDGGPVFDSAHEAQTILGAMMARQNEIIRTLDTDEYMPIFAEGDDGAPIVIDWCHGFMAGVALRAEAWEPFMRSRQSMFILPVMAHVPSLAGEDFDPASPPDFEPGLVIPACVEGMYAFWRKRRAKRAGNIVHVTETAMRIRARPKVGRNEACPCGSGKKFKKCCAAAAKG